VSQLFGVEQSDVEMQWEKDGKTKNAAVIAFRSKEAADAAQGELKSLHVPSGVNNWPLTMSAQDIMDPRRSTAGGRVRASLFVMPLTITGQSREKPCPRMTTLS
jgi:hypothetical protein